MIKEWQELTQLTQGKPFIVEKVRLEPDNIAIEGQFRLPPLARMEMEDQIFIAAFIHCHGSIKQMESIFGISYPTVKNRLNRLAGQLDFVKVDMSRSADNILDLLDRGDINVNEAIKRLRESKGEGDSTSEK